MNIEHIKVLLIEDDPADVELFQQSLKPVKCDAFDFKTAGSISEAISIFQKEKFDVIILDLTLPDSQGAKTFETVHEVALETPIMVLTGLDDEELALDLVQKGAQDYLIKSQVDGELLFRMIQYAAERKRLEQDLKSTQSQLLQSEKLSTIGQLIAGIAHEINNPISFVGGNLQTLETYIENQLKLFGMVGELKTAVVNKDFDGAQSTAEQMTVFEEKINLGFMIGDMDQLLQESLRGIERVKKIVMDLRNFAREGGDDMDVVQVDQIMEGVIGIVWNEIKAKVELRKDYQEVPSLKCSTQRIGQVFINLLLNAAQAIDGQGIIEIKIYYVKPNIHIDIHDSGQGIDQAHLEKIFEPFFTTKPTGQGTGLGLSISRDIIHKHDGHIEVESNPGEGTTFKIALPANE